MTTDEFVRSELFNTTRLHAQMNDALFTRGIVSDAFIAKNRCRAFISLLVRKRYASSSEDSEWTYLLHQMHMRGWLFCQEVEAIGHSTYILPSGLHHW